MNSAVKSSSRASLRHSVNRGALWLLSTNVAWQVVSWIATVVTARYLSPRDYGLLALSDTIFPYLLILSTLRLDIWVVRKLDITLEEESKVFTLALIAGVTTLLLGLVSADLVAKFYAEPTVKAPFMCLCLVFLLRSFQVVPDGRINRAMRFKFLGMMNLSIGIFRSAVQVVLAICGFAYWALVFGTVLSEFLKTVSLITAAGVPRSLRWDTKLFKQLLVVCFSALGATVAWIIYSTVDNVVVGKVLGMKILGIYAMAFYLIDLPLSKINAVLNPLLLPYYSRLSAHPNSHRSAFIRFSSTLLGVICPILLGLIAVAPELVLTAFGDRWVELITPLRILAAVGIYRATVSNIGNYFYSLDRPNDVLRTAVLPAAVLPPLLYLSATICEQMLGNGLLGVYIVLLLVFPLVGVVYPIHLASEVGGFRRRDFFLQLRPPVVAGSLMLGVLLLFGQALILFNSNIVKLLLMIPTGAIVYLTALWFGYRRYCLQALVRIRRLRKAA